MALMTAKSKDVRSSKRGPRNQRVRAYQIPRASWFVFDFSAGFLGCLLAFLFSPASWGNASLPSHHPTSLMASTVFGFLIIICSQIFQLHLTHDQRSPLPHIYRSMGCVLLALVLLLGFFFLLMFGRIGRWIVVQTFIYTTILMIVIRSMTHRITQDYKQRLILAGSPKFFNAMRKLIETQNLPFEILFMMDTRAKDPHLVTLSEPVASFPISEIREQCQQWNVGEIVLEHSHAVPPSIHVEIGECLLMGVQISSMHTFVERVWQIIPIDHIDHTWLHDLDLKLTNPFYLQGKRIMDILFSFFGLILSTPLLLVASLFIKLQDGGSILYSQTRIGQFGIPFVLYKLRTMTHGISHDDSIYTDVHDARVTWIGKILRKLRLDEIPQFWNVLRGEMSLVGPRAEWVKCTEIYEKEIPFYRFRHLVRPGITGWAQINYPYGASAEDAKNKLSYDLYYIKNLSLLFDSQIILQTIGSIMKGSR
ncbi:MAG: exopolysaccharide biosynthesis polyprenyl glycosylphosphotransferase [Verrucomicrobiota bacterium]